MPKIPIPTKTISQLVEKQVPSFVREDYPQFVAFVKAYYEWLEINGAEVFNGKIIGSTQNTVVLPEPAAINVNAYQDMALVVLNGPAKGHTRKITAYDPTTRTVTLETLWTTGFVPPANSMVAIRDSIYPDKLLSYRDIDATLDRFVNYFQTEFLYQIPGTLLADKRQVLKNIKDFYRARGTENSFRFLFRIMFGEEVEFYYPKVDLFRLSDARWSVENVMRISTTGNTFDYVDRLITGVGSGATAKVESATQSYIAGHTVTDLKLSSIDGVFTLDPISGLPEIVKINYPTVVPPQSDLGSLSDLVEPSQVTKWESAYQLLTHLIIENPGDNYVVGEEITISGGNELSSAKATVTAVFQKYFNGSSQPPPQSYYLQPFFGPDDTVNVTGDPLKDNVCIPGLFFFSDVHSQFTQSQLITSSEIILSVTETGVDNFFVGDEISLTGGTGKGQRRTILSYNGTTKVATVDSPFDPLPDATSTYSIFHTRGGIKAVQVTDFGLGFVNTPTPTIHTTSGGGATLTPRLGLVAQTAGQWLPGRDGGVGGAPTTTDSFASSNKVIQDSYYWQDFSYDLRFGQTINKYRDVVKALLHPAGMKMFGTVLLKSKPETHYFRLVEHLVLELKTKFFSDNKLKPLPTTLLDLSTIDPQVIGSRNKDLDAIKFTAFPPNVSFNIQYPFPNTSYWAVGATGNTQIGQFQNIPIGNIISNPNRRNKIAPDSYIRIDNTSTYAKVGPIGPSRATISKFRFVGFPPFEGFSETYPAPNSSYWTSFGNTQLSSFANILLSDVIVAPDTKRSNFCVDSDMTVFRNKVIPSVGDFCEYAFLEGIDPELVYNVSPNAHGEFDGVLGSTTATEASDPTWVNEGLALSSASNQIVNATGVPMKLSHCTVIVVAKVTDVDDSVSIVNCIPDSSTNGFSIDVLQNGGVSFRVQNGGISRSVAFPDATISGGSYFLAALRFDNGLLQGRINNSRPQSVRFVNYPGAPTTTSAGWYFGKPSATYVAVTKAPGMFGSVDYGQTVFDQAGTSGTTTTVTNFDGTLAYALFYDRPLYDFEIDFVYQNLKTRLLQDRSIVLP
jgi:hypothetical protein